MVSSIRFDSTVNTFGDLVIEVFSGTDEEQKTKLSQMLDHFTKIRNSEREKKLIKNILPPEMVETRPNQVQSSTVSNKIDSIIRNLFEMKNG